ncbi:MULTISPECIES: aldehyde dehydrogenase [Pontibacillus]|uniref:Aldehyde dehydrogenase n=1 Tax=Pontibacillus chungwhensis TaxID=265426 RepID=A0ABY8UTX4_9BACI|nr:MULTISPECIES: aldehyde dehydrogenase [Pontibacillus]MCD5323103.1 aldehyde dehydrogenase [Pontibacillus sp. HN14]WIF96492.1 aldehyde dehydrogenase [Pontibacillus chungwhensis]
MNTEELVHHQRTFYYTESTKPFSFRKEQLTNLRNMIAENEEAIIGALYKDLHKSEFESYTTEIGFLYSEITSTIKNLKDWMKPQKVKTPLTHAGSKSYLYKEPYGVTLIIAPWNYPFQLALAPVIGALAGGNTVILKPSELTPETSILLKKMVSKWFDASIFTVVEGDAEVSQELLEQRFDLIFFTGSVPVGKIVMEKASQHLTPVLLELGGKSPTIVDEDANLDLAAKRIAWGKYTNAGQTCIAPDYLYVHRSVKPELMSKLKAAIKDLYGEDPLYNEEYSHIVNRRHYERLCNYLHDGELLTGGEHDADLNAIEPTILDHISWDDSIMQEEIFGPILPVLTFDQLDEVIDEVRNHEKPLALYYFSKNEQKQEEILEKLSFGGGCINDTLFHVANPHLPFGGVGQSGVGTYHGKASFDAFTHSKGIVKQTTKFDLSIRYPGRKHGLKLIKKLLK